MNSGEDRFLRRARRGFIANLQNLAVVAHEDPVLDVLAGGGGHRQGGQGLPALMGFENFFKIQVDEDIGIHQPKALPPQEFFSGLDPAPGSEKLRLWRIVDLQSEAFSVPEGGLDLFAEMKKIDDQLLDSEFF